MSFQDIVILVIGLIVVVGGWVFNALKRSEQSSSNVEPGSTGRPDSATRSRMDELAARRRQQLQELARQRREEVGGQPVNLTMADAAERSQAKSVYERRAEALRRMREQEANAAGTNVSQTPSAAQQQQQVQQARARELARQRAEREARQRAIQRQQEIERQREQARARQRQQAQRAQQQQREQQQARKPQPAQQQRHQQRPDLIPVATDVLQEVVHQHKPLAYGQATPTESLIPPLNALSLRQAVILKEILDPPVGMRQNAEPYATA